MVKYLISRLFLVFSIKFFYGIAAGFFYENYYEYRLLQIIFIYIIFIGGFVIFFGFINAFYTLLRLSDVNRMNILKELGFKGSIKHFFSNIIDIFFKNLSHESERENGYILVLIFCLLISGNPLFSNYYGISSEFYYDSTFTFGERSIIIEKEKYDKEAVRNQVIYDDILFYGGDYGWDSIDEMRIDKLESYDKEAVNSLEINKKSFIFYEAAKLEGYEGGAYSLSYYFVCLFYYALEKLINIIIYFLIPTLIIYTYLIFKKPEK